MIERIAIADIRVGERRRKEMGNIEALARNIDQHGLIHPIVVSDDNELIAGERRLRAHEHLGLTTIPAQRWRVLDENQRREIELAENLDRKDLTTVERSRNLVALAETAAEVDRAEFRTDSVRNGPGRPQEPGSLRRVSERTGIPTNTIKTAQQHVAAVDAYPELEALPQSEAIETASALNALPEPDREDARVVLAMPPVADVAYELSDHAGKAELDRLRYRKRLGASLHHVATLASMFDPADVAGAIDDDFLRLNIDAALVSATDWAERVRAEMPSRLRVLNGGRS